ncbi:NUDIX domain-containing protein [Nocardioides zeae]|uniref:NUDIX domain-containing protein n=1 Tax=Nocardioides imazamoxiresistens TaxID=3231893 RepID=A0ABU3PWZ1_9ACTN|nr:NUDIX domain-containing protein [Nocardioides zeae]MDT9593756.1 NUDIX domain-containing protein [Nocardioides zeae]
MTLHADALAALESWTAPDADQERQREAYVAHLRAHADGVYRHGVPDHVTASAVVLDRTGSRTLLTLHARARRWFQLGGHCEEGDRTLAGAAFREAVEESGVPAERMRVDPVPVQLSPHPVPFCRPARLAALPEGCVVRHLDVRYLVVAEDDAQIAVSDESLDVRWWPVEALPDPDPELVAAVGLARRRLAQAGSPVSSPSAITSSSPGGGSVSVAADQPSR